MVVDTACEEPEQHPEPLPPESPIYYGTEIAEGRLSVENVMRIESKRVKALSAHFIDSLFNEEINITFYIANMGNMTRFWAAALLLVSCSYLEYVRCCCLSPPWESGCLKRRTPCRNDLSWNPTVI